MKFLRRKFFERINLLNYTNFKTSELIGLTNIELYKNSFEEFLKSGNEDYLKIATNSNPAISCYNSPNSFYNKIFIDDELHSLFDDCVRKLYNKDLMMIQSSEIAELMEKFGFQVSDVHDAYKKIIFYNMINYDSIVIKEIVEKQIVGNHPVSRIFFTNEEIKKYYKKHTEEICGLNFLSSEEKEYFINQITVKTVPAKDYTCAYYDEDRCDIEKYVLSVNQLIKNKGAIFVKRERKRREEKNTINYLVCNDGSVILISSDSTFDSTSSRRVAIRIKNVNRIAYPFDLSVCNLNLKELRITEDHLSISESELEIRNRMRTQLGLEPYSVEDFERTIYKITFDFYKEKYDTADSHQQ